MLRGHLLHGGDYNPEQWLDHPEILEEDIRLMQEAHVNCVSLGIFSWAVLEPSEGTYTLDWLEEIIDNLGKAGIQVILATPSGAMPHWLTARYPEVMQVQADGTAELGEVTVIPCSVSSRSDRNDYRPTPCGSDSAQAARVRSKLDGTFRPSAPAPAAETGTVSGSAPATAPAQ